MATSQSPESTPVTIAPSFGTSSDQTRQGPPEGAIPLRIGVTPFPDLYRLEGHSQLPDGGKDLNIILALTDLRRENFLWDAAEILLEGLWLLKESEDTYIIVRDIHGSGREEDDQVMLFSLSREGLGADADVDLEQQKTVDSPGSGNVAYLAHQLNLTYDTPSDVGPGVLGRSHFDKGDVIGPHMAVTER